MACFLTCLHTERSAASQQRQEAAASPRQRGRRARLEECDGGLPTGGRRIPRFARVHLVPQGLVSSARKHGATSHSFTHVLVRVHDARLC